MRDPYRSQVRAKRAATTIASERDPVPVAPRASRRAPRERLQWRESRRRARRSSVAIASIRRRGAPARQATTPAVTPSQERTTRKRRRSQERSLRRSRGARSALPEPRGRRKQSENEGQKSNSEANAEVRRVERFGRVDEFVDGTVAVVEANDEHVLVCAGFFYMRD